MRIPTGLGYSERRQIITNFFFQSLDGRFVLLNNMAAMCGELLACVPTSAPFLGHCDHNHAASVLQGPRHG